MYIFGTIFVKSFISVIKIFVGTHFPKCLSTDIQNGTGNLCFVLYPVEAKPYRSRWLGRWRAILPWKCDTGSCDRPATEHFQELRRLFVVCGCQLHKQRTKVHPNAQFPSSLKLKMLNIKNARDQCQTSMISKDVFQVINA